MLNMKRNRVKRKPNTFEVFFPIISMMVILFVGRVLMGINITALLVFASFVASIIAYRCGVSWNEMFEGITSKTHKGMGAIFLLIVVGAMLGAMVASGTVPMLIYYGVQIISARWLMATAFVLCCLISVATGTSWGSVATIGVTMMGIAMGLGINPAGVAGAVIGGSWFGDKLSPLSDTTNLAAAATETNLFDHIRQMLWTTIPACVIALIVYVVAGMSYSGAGSFNSDTVTNMITQLDSMYNWNVLLLLPVVLVLAGSVLKYPAIPVIFSAALISGIEAVAFQSITVKNVFQAVTKGFNTTMITKATFDSANVMPEITKLLHRGGMNSMLGTVLLIMAAFAFAGVMDSAGCLEGMLEQVTKLIKTDTSLLLSTIFTSLGIAIITNNFVSTLVLGEMYQGLYKKHGLDSSNLSRTLEDCGTCIIPLVPWSASGAYVIGMLGVAPSEYIPWAVFCWLCPLISVFFAITHIGIKYIKQDDASETKIPA